MNKRRRRKYLGPRVRIGEQFIAHPVALLKSEVWRSLKLAELRILHRLEIEHANHGGRQNGNLKTKSQGRFDPRSRGRFGPHESRKPDRRAPRGRH